MLNKLRGWLYKFMYGRYGVDELGKALLYVSLFILLPSYFIQSNVRYVFTGLFWILMFYSYFRIFSKKLYNRKKENDWYLGKTNYLRTRISQRKQYRFYDCPKCKTHLRVPRGAGNITITCKKCGYQFDRKA